MMMSGGWHELPDGVRRIAETVLTAKQLEAWRYELDGWGLRRIGLELDLSRGAVADRIEAAHRTLRRNGIHQDASGTWHTEEAA